jgi:hypothetical protein
LLATLILGEISLRVASGFARVWWNDRGLTRQLTADLDARRHQIKHVQGGTHEVPFFGEIGTEPIGPKDVRIDEASFEAAYRDYAERMEMTAATGARSLFVRYQFDFMGFRVANEGLARLAARRDVHRCGSGPRASAQGAPLLVGAAPQWRGIPPGPSGPRRRDPREARDRTCGCGVAASLIRLVRRSAAHLPTRAIEEPMQAWARMVLMVHPEHAREHRPIRHILASPSACSRARPVRC